MEVLCRGLLSVSYSLNTQLGADGFVVGSRFLALFQATFHAVLHYILYIIDPLFEIILLTTEMKCI